MTYKELGKEKKEIIKRFKELGKEKKHLREELAKLNKETIKKLKIGKQRAIEEAKRKEEVKKKKEEAKRKKEEKAKEKERMEKRKKYQDWLAKNNYDEKEMKITEDENIFTMWKKVSKITIN